MSEPRNPLGSSPARPLVSIVVRSHNYGRFLSAAIESALAQTYEPVEVVVVDDGSTDDSVSVAESFGPRIRLLTQANAGVERASNRAADAARGDLLVFLDADDELESTHVEELLAALRRAGDASYAYCRPMLVGARSGPMRCLAYSAYFLVRRTNFVHPTALVWRDDFLAVGGFSEDLGPHALEDWDLWLKLLEAGKRGTYVRTPTVRWRRHEGGSRNPEGPAESARSHAYIRGRHAGLSSAVSDWRGNLFFRVDLALAAADLVFGFTRWPRVVLALERGSWRRFRRWHAPKLPK